MTLISIIILGLVIGAVLGGLGGGGAILTVPALVYVVGQSAQDATTSSLVIVGLSAVAGVFSYVSSGQVRWRLALVFGLVGFPATWAGTFLNHRVDADLLLLGFSALMLVAAAAMIGDRLRGSHGNDNDNDSDKGDRLRARSSARPEAQNDTDQSATSSRLSVMEQTRTIDQARTSPRISTVPVVLTALAVGLLTGFFGVGGRFVIVPALVLVLRIPMQQAVGTSLLIVALNSGTSLLSRAGSAHFDWSVIVPFTLAAMLATIAGKQVADRLPARELKLGFAALLVLVACYTAWQSITGLAAADASSSTSTSSDPGAAAVDVSSPAQVRQAIAEGAVVIDVRTPQEYDAGHLTDAVNIDITPPLFRTQIDHLDRTVPGGAAYVVYCASGRRAATAITEMRPLGFTHLLNGGGYQNLAADPAIETSSAGVLDQAAMSRQAATS